jgi:hypothetical protein
MMEMNNYAGDGITIEQQRDQPDNGATVPRAIMRKLLILANALLRDRRTWSPKLA